MHSLIQENTHIIFCTPAILDENTKPELYYVGTKILTFTLLGMNYVKIIF